MPRSETDPRIGSSPEYGPASVFAENVAIDGVNRPAVAQTGSRVVLDGVEIPSEDIDIEALYERGYMKK